MIDFFSSKYSDEREKWQVVGNDGIAVDSFKTKGEADDEAYARNNCDHQQLDRPDWFGGDSLSTDYPEIEISCSNCGAVASFPVPINLEWGHE